MKTIEVVAAIIIRDNEILCMQRDVNPLGYISEKYEFPGGKIENGELKHEALMRELREEMDIELDITEKDFFLTVDHIYPDFRIIMHSYTCRVDDLEFKLNDHIGYKWLSKEDLYSLDWAPADIPIVKKLSEGEINEQ